MNLIDAIMCDNATTTKNLLEKGMPPNMTEDCALVSPLHFAAAFNATKCTQLLLAAGANPRSKTVDGETPLDIAKQHQNQQIIEVLRKVFH